MTPLDSVTSDDLRQVLDDVDGKKPTQRLMAAINYLEEDGATLASIAQRYGYTAGWLSRWLDRLERLDEEPYEDVVYDKPRSGRPRALSDAAYEQFVETLHHPPEDDGIDAGGWTVPLARQYLKTQFDVEYCQRHVRRLLSEAGLSWQSVSSDDDTADARDQQGQGKHSTQSETVWTSPRWSSP